METKFSFSSKSERVKAIDVHSSKAIVACGLYNGQVSLWDYVQRCQKHTMSIGKTSPIRAVRFIEPTEQLVCGADDGCCYVFHITTGEKVLSFQAHGDYVRCLTISLAPGLVLTGGDDARISAWNYAGDWSRVATVSGHSSYVMSLVMCPYDPFLFCSASLDKTVKIWGIRSDKLGFTVPSDPRCVLAHPCGVNCAIFHPKGGLNLPYVITGADDGKVRIWDFHNRLCVYTIAEHTSCVTCLSFVHSAYRKAWYLLSGSEDEFVNTYDTASYQLERRDHHSGGRVWAIQTAASYPNSESVEKQYEVIIIGSDRELNFAGPRQNTNTRVGVDLHHGRLVFSEQEKLFLCDLKDSQHLNLANVENDSTERMAAQLLTKLDAPVTSIQFDESSQFIAFTTLAGCNIHSTLSWKHCASGTCHGEAQKPFMWGQHPGQFIVLKALRVLELFDNFRNTGEVFVEQDIQGVFLGARGTIFGVVHADSGKHRGILSVYEWESRRRIRTVCFGTEIKDVIWNPDGSRLAIVGTRTIHLITWNRFTKGSTEEPFSMLQEIDAELPTSAQWIDNETLFYLNGYSLRVEYILYNTVYCALKGCYAKHMLTTPVTNASVCQSHVPLCIYSWQQGKVYFFEFPDKTRSCECLAWYAEFPYERVQSHKRLLGGKEEGEITIHSATSAIDDRNVFEIALRASSFESALSIAHKIKDPVIWRRLGDSSMKSGEYKVAIEAFSEAKEYEKLLVLCKATGNMEMLHELYESTHGVANEVAFSAAHLALRFQTAYDVLKKIDNSPHSALYAAQFCSQSRKKESIHICQTNVSDILSKNSEEDTRTASRSPQDTVLNYSIENFSHRNEEEILEKTSLAVHGIEDLLLSEPNTAREEASKELTNTSCESNFSSDLPLEQKQTELRDDSVNHVSIRNFRNNPSGIGSQEEIESIIDPTIDKDTDPHSSPEKNQSFSEFEMQSEENSSRYSEAEPVKEVHASWKEPFDDSETTHITQVEDDAVDFKVQFEESSSHDSDIDDQEAIVSSVTDEVSLTIDKEIDPHSPSQANQSSSKFEMQFDESSSHDSDTEPVEEEYVAHEKSFYENESIHVTQVEGDAIAENGDLLESRVIDETETPEPNVQITSGENSIDEPSSAFSVEDENEYHCFIDSDSAAHFSEEMKYIEPEMKLGTGNKSLIGDSDITSSKVDNTLGDTCAIDETIHLNSSSSSATSSDQKKCTSSEQIIENDKLQGESNLVTIKDETYREDSNFSFVFSESEESGADNVEESSTTKKTSWDDLFD